MSFQRVASAAVCVVCVLAASAVHAAPPKQSAPDGVVDSKTLDAAAFAQWVDGKETPVSAEQAKDGPAAVVVTDGKHPKDFRGIRFGLSRATGPRHLRIGFTKSVPVGSVLVAGGGRLSVLKPEAAYPGDLADESQWIPAERIAAGGPDRPGVGEGGYASWLLPAGTATRALRFSHEPRPGDREMSGQLAGVLVVPKRFANLAPQAVPQTRGRDDTSAKLVNERYDSWGAWDNGENGAAVAMSPERPEVITLTWPAPVEAS